MGYTTTFKGQFVLDRPLTAEHGAYLWKFSQTRRMKRQADLAEKMPDPHRLAVGLPIGKEACYFVGGLGFRGQGEDASIVEYNDEPKGQPGLWCQWVPTEDSRGLEWNRSEKFYHYTEWLIYIVEIFLKPWGYVLNGNVEWKGEDPGDRGTIHVNDNQVEAVEKPKRKKAKG